MNKVIRNGNVAILYSPDYGAGWYTWNKDFPSCVFSPEIVEMIEQGKRDEITERYCKQLFGEAFYGGGAEDLEIMWLPVGTAFEIDEYDGNESITTLDKLTLVA